MDNKLNTIIKVSTCIPEDFNTPIQLYAKSMETWLTGVTSQLPQDRWPEVIKRGLGRAIKDGSLAQYSHLNVKGAEIEFLAYYGPLVFVTTLNGYSLNVLATTRAYLNETISKYKSDDQK